MKTFKLTILFCLLFSGVFGVTVFHSRLPLTVNSKVIGYAISSVHSSLNPPVVFNKAASSADDNDVTDDSLDDDDDGCFSPREKTTSQANVCIAYIPYNDSRYRSGNDLQNRFYRTNNFLHQSNCNFISLRVFRL